MKTIYDRNHGKTFNICSDNSVDECVNKWEIIMRDICVEKEIFFWSTRWISHELNKSNEYLK